MRLKNKAHFHWINICRKKKKKLHKFKKHFNKGVHKGTKII